MTDERLSGLKRWLATMPGIRADSLRPASADASFRRYFRVDTDDGTVIAMDAPPEQENSTPFIQVASYLEQMGLNAPRVLATDLEQGYLLLTDLGTTHYLAGLDEFGADSLYRDAIDALLVLQRRGEAFQSELPPYDAERLAFEMSLFHDWLCEQHLGITFDEDAEAAWQATVTALVENALQQPKVFVHRDYHSRNLMVAGEDSPGIIDFQDAMEGPLTYDLVSLLKDCYVRWPVEQRDEWMSFFHAQLELDVDLDTFRRWFDLTGAQRHLKAAGIFCRLFIRDGKDGYLADIPLTLDYILELDGYPELEFVIGWIRDKVLPALEQKA